MDKNFIELTGKELSLIYGGFRGCNGRGRGRGRGGKPGTRGTSPGTISGTTNPGTIARGTTPGTLGG